jgi:hypothetical protein
MIVISSKSKKQENMKSNNHDLETFISNFSSEVDLSEFKNLIHQVEINSRRINIDIFD